MVIGPTIEDVIERVSLFRDREVTALPLSGGHMNTVFLVRADDVKYAVRVPGPSSELLAVDRANERHNAEAAAAAGVSPRVLEYLDDWNVMMLEYVEGQDDVCQGARLSCADPEKLRIAAEASRGASVPNRLRHVQYDRKLAPRVRRAGDHRSRRPTRADGPAERCPARPRRPAALDPEFRDATARAFTVDGWLRTADLGSLDDDGHVTVHGRRDDAIRSGGETVWPDEVERALVDHPRIRSVAVAGRPDRDWGELVTAWVVPATTDDPPDLDELREHCRDRLPRFAAPRELVLDHDLPTTTVGQGDAKAPPTVTAHAAMPGR